MSFDRQLLPLLFAVLLLATGAIGAVAAAEGSAAKEYTTGAASPPAAGGEVILGSGVLGDVEIVFPADTPDGIEWGIPGYDSGSGSSSDSDSGSSDDSSDDSANDGGSDDAPTLGSDWGRPPDSGSSTSTPTDPDPAPSTPVDLSTPTASSSGEVNGGGRVATDPNDRDGDGDFFDNPNGADPTPGQGPPGYANNSSGGNGPFGLQWPDWFGWVDSVLNALSDPLGVFQDGARNLLEYIISRPVPRSGGEPAWFDRPDGEVSSTVYDLTWTMAVPAAFMISLLYIILAQGMQGILPPGLVPRQKVAGERWAALGRIFHTMLGWSISVAVLVIVESLSTWLIPTGQEIIPGGQAGLEQMAAVGLVAVILWFISGVLVILALIVWFLSWVGATIAPVAYPFVVGMRPPNLPVLRHFDVLPSESTLIALMATPLPTAFILGIGYPVINTIRSATGGADAIFGVPATILLTIFMWAAALLAPIFMILRARSLRPAAMVVAGALGAAGGYSLGRSQGAATQAAGAASSAGGAAAGSAAGSAAGALGSGKKAAGALASGGSEAASALPGGGGDGGGGSSMSAVSGSPFSEGKQAVADGGTMTAAGSSAMGGAGGGAGGVGGAPGSVSGVAGAPASGSGYAGGYAGGSGGGSGGTSSGGSAGGSAGGSSWSEQSERMDPTDLPEGQNYQVGYEDSSGEWQPIQPAKHDREWLVEKGAHERMEEVYGRGLYAKGEDGEVYDIRSNGGSR